MLCSFLLGPRSGGGQGWGQQPALPAGVNCSHWLLAVELQAL